DRSEPCYSGNVHEGSRDILVIANPERNAVFAKCDSARMDVGTGLCCKELPARYLGPFYVDIETWKDGAVEVNMRYLERKPLAAAPMDLQQIRSGARGLTDMVVFNERYEQAGHLCRLEAKSPIILVPCRPLPEQRSCLLLWGGLKSEENSPPRDSKTCPLFWKGGADCQRTDPPRAQKAVRCCGGVKYEVNAPPRDSKVCSLFWGGRNGSERIPPQQRTLSAVVESL
ncbi:hypothetical protein KFL_011360010, partial [Klebsormidium nitens]